MPEKEPRKETALKPKSKIFGYELLLTDNDFLAVCRTALRATGELE